MLDQVINILIQSSWQILVLSLIVYPLSRLSIRAYPNFAYVLWTIVLIKALLPLNFHVAMQNESLTTLAPVITGNFFLEPEAGGTRVLNLNLIFGTLWILGVSFFGFKLLVSELLHRHRMSEAELLNLGGWFKEMKAHLGIKRMVRVFSSSRIESPFMQGLFRVKVYVPADFTHWSMEEKRNVIAHELIHIKRLDILVIYLQAIVRILYFFHPAILLVNDQIDLEREKICDDQAIDLAKSNRVSYGKQLFNQLHKESGYRPDTVLAGGFFMTDSSVIKRFRYIKEKRGTMSQSLKFHHILLIAIVLSTALLMACASNEQVMKKDQFEKQKSLEVGFVEFDVPPQPVDGMMSIMKNVLYPEEERKAGTEGKSIVSVVIDKSGKVKAVEIAQSSGSQALDKAAIEAIKTTKWNPAMRGDEAVTAKVVIPIMFKLHEKEGAPAEGSTKGKE